MDPETLQHSLLAAGWIEAVPLDGELSRGSRRWRARTPEPPPVVED